MVLALQAEPSYRQVYDAVPVRLQPVPLHRHVEGGHRVSQPHLEVVPLAVHHLLEVVDQSQHREHRLDHHPLVPRPARAEVEVLRVTSFGMKAGVAADSHLLLVAPDERLKDRVGDVGRVARPGYHQTRLVEQQTVLAAALGR